MTKKNIFMEETQFDKKEAMAALVQYTADLYITQDKNSHEVITALKERGISEEVAKSLIEALDEKLEKVENAAHKNNIIIGGLFFVGGLIATFANLGFVFWGAIVFGGIQMFRGLLRM